jgi:hypothetical protein
MEDSVSVVPDSPSFRGLVSAIGVSEEDGASLWTFSM